MRARKIRRQRTSTQFGTAALVLKLIRQTEDNVLVIVQGLRRLSLRKIVATSPFLRAEVDLPQSIVPEESKEWEATFRNLRDSAARLFELSPDAPEQARLMILNIESPEQLADFLAPNLNVDVRAEAGITRGARRREAGPRNSKTNFGAT